MTTSSHLKAAAKRKDDEFYTLPADVERINALILEADPYSFAGRTVMCPCDDPDRSEWTRYYEANLRRLGLLRVISTCYRPGGRGRVRITGPDGVERDGLLDGDGGFQTPEVTDLARQADIIATNPPFSLMRAFIPWAMAGHRIITVMPLTAFGYNAVIPYFAQGRLHATGHVRTFLRPDGSTERLGDAMSVTDLRSATDNTPLPLPATRDVRGELRRLDTGMMEARFCRLIPGDFDAPLAVPASALEHIDQSKFEVLGKFEPALLGGRHIFKRIVIRRRTRHVVPVPPKATIWNKRGTKTITSPGPDWTPSQNIYSIHSDNVDKTLM